MDIEFSEDDLAFQKKVVNFIEAAQGYGNVDQKE